MSDEAFRPPAHFRHEQQELERRGLASWAALAALADADLRRLAAEGRASEQRLRRLRGQARLIQEVGVTPARPPCCCMPARMLGNAGAMLRDTFQPMAG